MDRAGTGGLGIGMERSRKPEETALWRRVLVPSFGVPRRRSASQQQSENLFVKYNKFRLCYRPSQLHGGSDQSPAATFQHARSGSVHLNPGSRPSGVRRCGYRMPGEFSARTTHGGQHRSDWGTEEPQRAARASTRRLYQPWGVLPNARVLPRHWLVPSR